MSEDRRQFASRIRKLERKHKAMGNGYVGHIRPDGLIEIAPQRRRPRGLLRPTLVTLAALLLFKGFVMAWLGGAEYDTRVARLHGGSMLEQLGAVVMTPEAASQFIADQLAPVLG